MAAGWWPGRACAAPQCSPRVPGSLRRTSANASKQQPGPSIGEMTSLEDPWVVARDEAGPRYTKNHWRSGGSLRFGSIVDLDCINQVAVILSHSGCRLWSWLRSPVGSPASVHPPVAPLPESPKELTEVAARCLDFDCLQASSAQVLAFEPLPFRLSVDDLATNLAVPLATLSDVRF